MPYELKDLIVDRVDLVDEGANSAAFIEFYKRKETPKPMDFNEILAKLKPEHADVIKQALEVKDVELSKARGDLNTANQSLTDKDAELFAANKALAAANAEIETLKAKSDTCLCDGNVGDDGMCQNCHKPKKATSFDENETIKSMPEPMRAMFLKMREQKEAAEEQIRKAAEREAESKAITKAARLKAIPVAQEKLVGVLKNCSAEVEELLIAANDAIETTVLGEVGKNRGNGAATSTTATSDEAWDKLEKRAVEVAKRDSVTKEKAMATVITENPELYREYLNGGTK